MNEEQECNTCKHYEPMGGYCQLDGKNRHGYDGEDCDDWEEWKE